MTGPRGEFRTQLAVSDSFAGTHDDLTLEASRLIVPVIPERCQLGEMASDELDKPSCGDDLAFAGAP